MRCVICGAKLVRWRAIRDMGPEKWAELKAEGCRRLCTKTSCNPCKKRGGKPRQRWQLDALLEEAEFLFGYGMSADRVAARLGLKTNSLAQAYLRARKRGLTTRRVPFDNYRRSS